MHYIQCFSNSSLLSMHIVEELCVQVARRGPVHPGVRRHALRWIQLQAPREADHHRGLL